MSTPDFKLLALFSLIAAAIVLRVKVESTGYRSPDSWYYLECSQNILDGNGFYHSNEYPIPEIKTPENQTYFAVWPVGYPLLIAGFALLFSLSVFWASKLVNIFFLGLCCLLFRKMNKEYAYLLLSIMCSFTFLEVYSYTWSEAPFLFALLWFGYSLFNFLQRGYQNIYLVQLFLSGILMFLFRYVGAFSLIILGTLTIYFFLHKKYNPTLKLFLITLLLFIAIGLYFYNNYLQTGYITGGERLYPDQENIGIFLWFLFVGLFNEFFIIRNYYWQGENPDFLFVATAAFQLVLMGFFYLKFLKGKHIINLSRNKLSTFYYIIGFSYLFILIIIRAFSPFDPFDYRLLSPFTICIYTALILSLIDYQILNKLRGAHTYMIILFSVSLILNLPKEFLYQTFKKLFLMH